MGANYGGDGSSKQFFNIIDGKIVKTVKKEEAINQLTGQMNPGYHQRTKKTGDVTYEREVTFGLDGKIVRIDYMPETRFGPQIEVGIKEDGNDTEYVLQFGATNSNRSFTDNARSFIEQLPFVDFDAWVRVNSYKYAPKDSDKTFYGLTIFVKDAQGNDVSIKKIHGDTIEAKRKTMPRAEEVPNPTNPNKPDLNWVKNSQAVYNDLQIQIKRLVESSAPTGTVPSPAQQPATPQQAAPQPAVAVTTDDLPF